MAAISAQVWWSSSLSISAMVLALVCRIFQAGSGTGRVRVRCWPPARRAWAVMVPLVRVTVTSVSSSRARRLHRAAPGPGPAAEPALSLTVTVPSGRIAEAAPTSHNVTTNSRTPAVHTAGPHHANRLESMALAPVHQVRPRRAAVAVLLCAVRPGRPESDAGDPLLVRHAYSVACRRSPGQRPLPRYALVRRNRMLLWSTLVVRMWALRSDISGHAPCGSGRDDKPNLTVRRCLTPGGRPLDNYHVRRCRVGAEKFNGESWVGNSRADRPSCP